VLPSPPPPDEEGDRKRRAKKRDRTTAVRQEPTRTPKPETRDEPTRSPKPSPTTSAPKPSPTPTTSPKPSPSPSPTPDGPVLVTLTGTLSACETGWCVGGTEIELGPATQDGADAAHDYDGDGVIGSNAEELDGLVGSPVTVQVEEGTGLLFVIDGKDYRYADGTFA
jgi:hypothetical protein